MKFSLQRSPRYVFAPIFLSESKNFVDIPKLNVKVNIGSSQIFCMEFMYREINDLIFYEDAYAIMIMT